MARLEIGEPFYQLEVGLERAGRHRRADTGARADDNNNIHLTGWYKDAQPDAAPQLQPQARGLAFNANMMIGDNLMWFSGPGSLRAG